MKRRYARLPGREHLTPKLEQLAAEADKLAERLASTEKERNRLGQESLTQQAIQADRDAAAVAVRAGKSASSVGVTHLDELTGQREKIQPEVDAIGQALVAVESEMTAEFERMLGDEKTSGRAAIKPAADRYRKSLASLVEARTEYWRCAGLVAYLKDAASAFAGMPRPVDYAGPASPLIAVNKIQLDGDMSTRMRPVTIDHLLANTLAPEVEEKP